MRISDWSSDVCPSDLATLMHVSNLYGSPQQEHFAQRLVDSTFADTVFFTNSGAEAVECAIKTARRYHFVTGNPQRHALICFSNAFHGRTLGTISATNQEKMRGGFEPLLPGFTVVDFNDLAAAEAAITDETAGFMLEPVQGEGGIRPATQEFLSGLRALCDKRSEEHTSELQSLMRISYAVFCLKKKKATDRYTE